MVRFGKRKSKPIPFAGAAPIAHFAPNDDGDEEEIDEESQDLSDLNEYGQPNRPPPTITTTQPNFGMR